MKKYLFAFALLIAISPLSASASLENDLKYGSKSSAVLELQEFLIDKGFLKSQPTGSFYALTKSAVMAYQVSEGLPSTGFVGPMTRAKINASLGNDTEAEIQETGTVTAPVVSNETSTMQKQLDDLKALLADLISKQVTQAQKIEDTNVKLGAIVENTTPAPVVQTPAPVVKEVVKELVVTAPATGKVNVPFDIVVMYTEDGAPKSQSFIVINHDGNNNTNTDGSIKTPAPGPHDHWMYKVQKFPESASVNNGFACGISYCKAAFSYISPTKGSKKFTVTASNGMTKEVTIEVSK